MILNHVDYLNSTRLGRFSALLTKTSFDLIVKFLISFLRLRSSALVAIKSLIKKIAFFFPPK